MIYELITNGVDYDCEKINEAIGVGKDLLIVNYKDFDKVGTLRDIEENNDNNNLYGLTSIKLAEGANIITFSGTEYSITPSIAAETREDGTLKFTHKVSFTVYSKTSETRETLLKFGRARVIAITLDKSTGFYELFGAERGLVIDSIDRSYSGSQASNFYTASISTPSYSVLKESKMGQLSKEIIYSEDSFEGDFEYEL